MILQVGIACENWKAPEFERELAKAGFKFKTHLGTEAKPVAAIIVQCAKSEVLKLHGLCATLQSRFYHRKQGEN